VVTYIDSHACELAKGGYEVFLLMEFCSGFFVYKHLLTRDRWWINRFHEYEITGPFDRIGNLKNLW
jgi:hypothetical protein